MKEVLSMYNNFRNGVLQKEWDKNCSKKSSKFLEARARGDFEKCFYEFVKNSKITLDNERFIYFLDNDFCFDTSIQNITPNYNKILKGSLKELFYTDDECSNVFTERYNSVLTGIKFFVERIIVALDNKGMNKQATWFRDIIHKPALHFEEGLQRILFLNQLLWQTKSRLIGLGRLDIDLYKLYQNDLNTGVIAREDAKIMIGDFLKILHRDYWFKSDALLGDTGQVIIVGGLNKNGEYECNDLTYMFIEEVAKSNASDPKIVLRVSEKMPRELMKSAVSCMSTGCGSPLLSNDDVIIPKLIDFGVEEKDAYCYATSACWEPLICGKSSSMNNQNLLLYPKALHNLLLEEKLDSVENFDEFMNRYYVYLRREIIVCMRELYEQQYLRNTLYSIFIDGCRESKKDIVDGGAHYHNVGMTVAGLGNTVNSLLNVKKMVFDEHRYSLKDVKNICILDYEDAEADLSYLKLNSSNYATDNDEAIYLTNCLQKFVSELTVDFRTSIGGKLKFGASSPSHIMAGESTKATFDGRRANESLTVHISNDKAKSYTEVINFAAELDYNENRFNGNVVDLVVSPVFMERHFDKFTELMLKATKVGFFQLQTNVVRSDKLVEAKKHPELYGGLIVRVWGFSAYFVELPEIYQDLLIERALQAERRVA